MSEPVNKDRLHTILAEFMESIEEWESEIAGSPSNAELAELENIYNETIDQLDKEYFKNINQAYTEHKESMKLAKPNQ